MSRHWSQRTWRHAPQGAAGGSASVTTATARNFRVPSDARSLLFGTKIADEYLQPHIGGDIALLTGLAKAILAAGAHDQRFIAHHPEGFEAFRTHAQAGPWRAIARSPGVPRARGPVCGGSEWRFPAAWRLRR